VNNVGGTVPVPLADMTDEIWLHTLSLSLTSAFYATRKALSLMTPRRSGRIINMGSAASKTAFFGLGAYTAAKHGMLGLTRATAFEAAPLGITANMICPGPIITDMVRQGAAALGITAEKLLEPIFDRTLTRQYNTVEQIGATAVLLASEAGAGITGTAISVDGGITLD
jgi:3-hydroxybutyrate dehydrogenase